MKDSFENAVEVAAGDWPPRTDTEFGPCISGIFILRSGDGNRHDGFLEEDDSHLK